MYKSTFLALAPCLWWCPKSLVSFHFIPQLLSLAFSLPPAPREGEKAAWGCQPLPRQHSQSRSWARALWEPSSAPLRARAVQTPLEPALGYLPAGTSVRHFLGDNGILLIKKKKKGSYSVLTN